MINVALFRDLDSSLHLAMALLAKFRPEEVVFYNVDFFSPFRLDVEVTGV